MLLRGFIAILAGLGVVMMLVVVFTWTVSELLGVAANEVTTASMVAHMLIWALMPVVGGYLTGRMASTRSFLHGIGLGVLLLAIAGIPLILNGPRLQQPDWYPAATGAVMLMGASLGGWLAARYESADSSTSTRDE